MFLQSLKKKKKTLKSLVCLFQRLHYENNTTIFYKTLKQSNEEIQLFSVKRAARDLRPVLLPYTCFWCISAGIV